jgi:hypothetical protein
LLLQRVLRCVCVSAAPRAREATRVLLLMLLRGWMVLVLVLVLVLLLLLLLRGVAGPSRPAPTRTPGLHHTPCDGYRMAYGVWRVYRMGLIRESYRGRIPSG